MDANQFLAEFGHIANAPRGVARLRELVLHLAVSGQLTNQATKESAISFFSEIASRREVLESNGEIRANRKIRNEGVRGAWKIPDNWHWCRFGELCSFSAGRTPSRKESKYWNTGDYPWLSIADLEHGEIINRSSETTSESARAEVFKSAPAPAGSLLMSFKLTIGKLCLLGVDSYHNEAIIRIEPFDEELKNFFFKCLNGFDLSSGNKAAIKGNTLNQDSISNIEIALPPKEEISRIVAKVDELMTLCDLLEAQQKKRRTLQNNLRQSTLQAVAASQSSQELKESWQRLQTNFGQLFSAPEDVEDVRQLAMELAVRGLLTEQRDTDESANHILLRCAEEHKDLVRNGEMKRRKPLPEIDASQAPFDLPKGWVWARFPELGIFGRGKSKHRPRNDPKLFTPGIYPLVQTGQVARAGNLINEYHSKYSEVGLAQSKLWPEGTLCITIAANIADSAILGFEACFPDSVVGFIPAKELRDKVEYFLLFMKTAREQLLAFAPSTAQKNINLQILESVLIPVPPKEEITRILSRMGQINTLCDTILSARSKSLSIGKLLAETSVATLTGIAIEQEEEPMKAPQTELVAPVRLGTPPGVKAQAPLATILARHSGEMSAKDLWQRFGGEIDAFYAQLKAEVAHGWILEPEKAEMLEKIEE